jgi:hypothetical protein
VNCEICRARMCTDGLLSKVRCAECRQIKFAQFREIAEKASLIVLGGFLAWYIFRLAEREDSAVQEASVHPADLTAELIACRRRA